MDKNEFFKMLLTTSNDVNIALVRIVAGVIIFPYGIQKVFSSFGWWGIKGTIENMKSKNIPFFIAYLVIIGQSLGSLALIFGVMGRVAALGNFIIFSGAMLPHLKDGWSMNWFNKKEGEGIEYFVMLLTLLLIVLINGSGAWSIDLVLNP